MSSTPFMQLYVGDYLADTLETRVTVNPIPSFGGSATKYGAAPKRDPKDMCK